MTRNQEGFFSSECGRFSSKARSSAIEINKLTIDRNQNTISCWLYNQQIKLEACSKTETNNQSKKPAKWPKCKSPARFAYRHDAKQHRKKGPGPKTTTKKTGTRCQYASYGSSDPNLYRRRLSKRSNGQNKNELMDKTKQVTKRIPSCQHASENKQDCCLRKTIH